MLRTCRVVTPLTLALTLAPRTAGGPEEGPIDVPPVGTGIVVGLYSPVYGRHLRSVTRSLLASSELRRGDTRQASRLSPALEGECKLKFTVIFEEKIS